jgi:molecular chaperone DnaJ
VNLSARQRELLEEFENAGKNNSPATQDFFSRVKGFWDGMTG